MCVKARFLWSLGNLRYENPWTIASHIAFSDCLLRLKWFEHPTSQPTQHITNISNQNHPEEDSGQAVLSWLVHSQTWFVVSKSSVLSWPEERVRTHTPRGSFVQSLTASAGLVWRWANGLHFAPVPGSSRNITGDMTLLEVLWFYDNYIDCHHLPPWKVYIFWIGIVEYDHPAIFFVILTFAIFIQFLHGGMAILRNIRNYGHGIHLTMAHICRSSPKQCTSPTLFPPIPPGLFKIQQAGKLTG